MAADEPTPTLDPDPVTPRRRWPMGTLTLVGIATVIVGGLVLGGLRSSPTTTSGLPFDVEDLPAGAAVPTLPAPGTPPAAGEPAPDFTIELFDGSLFSLSSHLEDDGRPVFLNLWASWCIPCRVEMPAIEQASVDRPDVLFLGVAVEDDPTAAEEFGAEIGVTYPLAAEETDSFAVDYRYFGLPASYLISDEGQIVSRVFGGVDEEALADLITEWFGAP